MNLNTCDRIHASFTTRRLIDRKIKAIALWEETAIAFCKAP
ncbi:hypothetical protein [Nostoc sp. JL33]|nr:hypothetical protein [Nostoc sp. JL33]